MLTSDSVAYVYLNVQCVDGMADGRLCYGMAIIMEPNSLKFKKT